MKHKLESMLQQALQKLQQKGVVPVEISPSIKIENSKDRSHGDYASNLALVLAKPCQQPPRVLAEALIDFLPQETFVDKVEVAGAGFINFFIKEDAVADIVKQVISEGRRFGKSTIGNGNKIIIEFVSANPTGPLHVGHGRGAAFGATLANLLTEAGYTVTKEYYVNDAGRQMDILAVSVWLRYLECAGETIQFPANGYRGDYVQDIAKSMYSAYEAAYSHPWFEVKEGLPADAEEGGDKELYIDSMIHRAKDILGEDAFHLFHEHALNAVLEDIKNDLSEFGVDFDDWFSEKTLFHDGSIQKAIQALIDSGHTYEKEGALWFKATDFGDEKDRVLVRANGRFTYFASDAAYHWNKYDRGYDRVVDVMGADHHGYISRIKAAVMALGHDKEALDVELVQFAILYRGGERVQMSTRSGSFVTLRELRNEVGNDAARFFYVARKPEQHLDFDLDIAKSKSNENPVYYIQYAHARICSVLKQLKERGLSWNQSKGFENVHLLNESYEQALMTQIRQYPDVVESAASNSQPHQIAYFLRELAHGLHSYYNAVILLCPDEDLRSARLCLLQAVRQVIYNGLTILGVTAPESM